MIAIFVHLFAYITFVVIADEVKAMLCTIGQEPNPASHSRYRWVIPVEDPCQCTEVRVGSLNTQTPCRPFKVTYYDNFLHSSDPAEIRKWLKCTVEAHRGELCGNHLGMEDGSIPDSRITASSIYEERDSPDNCRPSNGRLNNPGSGDEFGGWCPAEGDKDPWFQVDLVELVQVEGVIIQGSIDPLGEWFEYVTAYQVLYSEDETNWRYVTDGTTETTAQTFPGNTDQTTPVTNMFAQPIEARYVRIKPTDSSEWPSMRVELIGCKGR